MLSIYYATKRLTDIDARLNKLETELARLPEGRLHISSSKSRTQFYLFQGSKGKQNYSKKYIPASKRATAFALAKKEFFEAEYADLLAERCSLESFLLSLEKISFSSSVKKLERRSPSFLELIRGGNSSSWANGHFTSSAPNQDARRIRAIDGTMVRSKSEAEIIMLLIKYGIPYRYECDLCFDGRIIGCPDFTLMHPATREIIIWEHFGLLDDPYYVRRNIYKVQKYIEAGYYPMINFIVTSETASKPFDITLADSLIRQFLLQ